MKKGLISVMMANVICLIINVLTNFLVPKYVSIESYSLIKTYTLYIGYAGFFSLGYNDGMYLKYGGKDLNSLNKKDLADNLINYIILISLILVITFTVGCVLNDIILIAFSFGMFSYNILGYLKSLYQATGEFSSYGKALNAEKIFVFVFTLCLIFIVGTDNANWYIWTQVIVGVIIAMWLFVRLDKKMYFLSLGRIKLAEFKDNISSGIILMLGNFSSSIFTGLDRWFVKFLLTTIDFAMYSFAVSMESVINTFISPITVAMYNYFCKNPNKDDIIKVKKMSLIWGFIVIGAAFPAKFILECFLSNYILANSVIFLLFAAQVFYIIVKGIYVNIYKAEKKQNLYLKQMIAMICVGSILNAILFFFFRNMIAIAAATLITAGIWMYFCEATNNNISFTIKEHLGIIIVIIVYLFCGYNFKAIVGFFVYISTVFVIIFTLFHSTFIYVISFFKSFLKKISN